MRTTLDLPDDLFRQVKAKAALEGATLKEYADAVHRERFAPARPARRESLAGGAPCPCYAEARQRGDSQPDLRNCKPGWKRRKTLPSSTDLLDANVWLALAAGAHTHHDRAKAYWENEAAPVSAFCRVTQLAFLRHLTNKAIMGDQVLRPLAAWKKLQEFLALPEVRAWPNRRVWMSGWGISAAWAGPHRTSGQTRIWLRLPSVPACGWSPLTTGSPASKDWNC